MGEKRINELTKVLKAKEDWLAFYTWETGKKYGIDLSQSQIEDIIGDAYLKAVTKLRNDVSLNIGYYLSWFVRILFLTTMNALRKAGRTSHPIDVSDIKDLSTTNFVYESFDRNYHNSFFKHELQKVLSNQEYTILKLTVEGYSSEEIANSLKLSKDNVRQIRHRAVKKIKKVFN